MNEYFPTVVPVIPLDNFHEQVLLHGIFLATEMSPVTLTLIRLLYMSAIKNTNYFTLPKHDIILHI